MHGEKVLALRDSFAVFDEFYVWDSHYKTIFETLNVKAKFFIKNKKMVGLVFGIVPEWQRKGIDGFMIWEGTKHFRKTRNYTDYEMQWIGDFNPRMIKIAENLETKVTRKLATYRYIFDRNLSFERHKML